MDYVVKSWILGTLTDDLAEIISSQGASAKDAWLAVESLFLGNREVRSIQLETKFCNFIQGDLSVTDYCRRMKKMADDLVVTGEIVTNRTLVLNVIRGLNERFTHIGTLLRRARPFPSFLEARDDLVLEEITMENRQTPAAALTASTKVAAPAPQQQQATSGSGGATRPAPSLRTVAVAATATTARAAPASAPRGCSHSRPAAPLGPRARLVGFIILALSISSFTYGKGYY